MRDARYWLERKRVLEQRGQLELVERERADGGRGRGIAAGVEWFPAEDLFELRRYPRPCAVVGRLLLRPHDAGVGVLLGNFIQPLPVQRIQLLDPDDRGVLNLVLPAIVDEVVVDLSRAENYPAGGFGFRGE